MRQIGTEQHPAPQSIKDPHCWIMAFYSPSCLSRIYEKPIRIWKRNRIGR
jgi:hypothetical protein